MINHCPAMPCSQIMAFFGEPQWAVVGDTFPVGCKHQVTIIIQNKEDIEFTYEEAIYKRKQESKKQVRIKPGYR